MCGIAGIWDVHHDLNAETLAADARAMTRAIRYRGPDDEGHFQDEAAGLVLGHRRLAIVDLSPMGHQPMVSASGRYVIAFNGEVYNHARLRPELESAGYTFRGHSDTEVMLAAIEHWGLEKALVRFIGMFAFALWDRETRALILVRDRLGIKPLYFGWVGSRFVFGSDLHAIRALPGFANPVDRDALSLYMRHNYIPAPLSIHRGLHKLLPGTWLRVESELAARPADKVALVARAQVYWSAQQVAESGVEERCNVSDVEAVDGLDRVLRNAVALRMEADVPLGAFLSGGVDSSTVVALMQAQSTRPIKTFTIGFHEKGYDEALHARAVARHLGTEHHELYVTAQDALDVVPQLPFIFDEPFADSSQIPTWLVSKLARSHVTVSLSGDGGDELFCGYERYFKAEQIRRKLEKIPPVMRGVMARSLSAHSGLWGKAFILGNSMLSGRSRLSNSGEKVGTLARMLRAGSADEQYRALVSHWDNPRMILRDGNDPQTALNDPALRPGFPNALDRMMYSDLVTYLPGDILTKVDRASMAVSLEARVPLLDHRVVEYAWQIPLGQKVRDGQGKWLLRQVLDRYVPRNLIERPKMGFGAPIGDWLCGPLRDWAESLLDERRLREEDYFDPAVVRRMWNDHLSGRVKDHFRLWEILMFQAWLQGQDRLTMQPATHRHPGMQSRACE